MVVACMGEGVSTPWAYGKLDEMNADFSVQKEEDPRLTQLVTDLKNSVTPPDLNAFYNIFEEVVPAEKPAVTALKESMLANGALRAMMSGSGPSVFGIFASVQEAEQACSAARELGADAFVCYPRPAYR
jgi:4-diphosphocytidyl-2-C-methyl-D-erythritol kinase